MRKEQVFLGYDENNKEIIEVMNVFNKHEMITIFEACEKELKENYICIDMSCPHVFDVDIHVIETADDDDEFILNKATKQIELFIC